LRAFVFALLYPLIPNDAKMPTKMTVTTNSMKVIPDLFFIFFDYRHSAPTHDGITISAVIVYVQVEAAHEGKQATHE